MIHTQEITRKILESYGIQHGRFFTLMGFNMEDPLTYMGFSMEYSFILWESTWEISYNLVGFNKEDS